MKVVRVSAIFMTLMVIGVQQGTPLLSDIWDTIKLGYSVASKLAEGRSAYDLITTDTGEKLDTIYTAIRTIMKDQHELANRMEAKVQIMMNNLAKDIKANVEFNSLRNKLTHDYIGRVNTAHKLIYDASERNYTDRTKYEIAKQLTSHGPNEIHDNLGHIAQLIIPGGSSYFSNFIDVLLELTELKTVNRCGKGSSLQQEVYHLYELLAATERIAFTTLSYAYTIRAKHAKVDFTNEINGARTDMVDRTRQYMGIIKKAMAKVSTEIHACEPSEYIRNENYIELERLKQLVVLPEHETSDRHSCRESCYRFTANEAHFYAKTVNQDEIRGTNCLKCESAGRTSLCYPKDINNSHRYYGASAKFEEDQTETFYGNMSECYNGGNGVYPTSEYHTSIHTLTTRCDICVCSCVNHEIDTKWRHSLSMKAEESDISKNMVVIGIRFHKTNTSKSGQVIYPQIKVGKLLPGGEISNPVWKNPEIDPQYEPGVNGQETYRVFGRQYNQANIVNLEDSYAKPNHVITGVKFIYRDDMWRVKRPWHAVHNGVDDGKSVGLFVRMTRCNFTTAKLFPDSTKYGHPDYDVAVASANPWRREYGLWDSDVPIKSTTVKPLFNDRGYIRFTMSDKKKDFGQSTIPFFDIQPVETSPPAPLSGVGLFLKGEKNFGGFLAFKVMTLNMTNVIDNGVPEPEPGLNDPYTGGISVPVPLARSKS